MALKKPLVLYSGEIAQLQAGDDLNVPFSGTINISQTNDEAAPIVIGTPVYNDAADGVKKAKANAAGTSKVLGLVAQTSITNAVAGDIGIDGVLTATTGQWDAVTGQVGGLTFGSPYYLDPTTAGMLTVTAPTTAGQYVAAVGIAISTTEMKVSVQPRILL